MGEIDHSIDTLEGSPPLTAEQIVERLAEILTSADAPEPMKQWASAWMQGFGAQPSKVLQ